MALRSTLALARALWLGLGLLCGLLGLAGCEGGAGYQRKGGAWTYGGVAFTPADPASFRPLDRWFARDARHGYYRGGVVPGSSGAHFAPLSENEARDDHAVYYCDTYRKAQEYWTVQYLRMAPVPGADAATYRVLGHAYASDSRRVYHEGEPFPVRDVASFEPLDARFARDAQRGYFDRAEIPGSHGPSFALVDARDAQYARDRAHAYHGHTEVNQPNQRPHPVVRTLRGADLAALRVLGRGYASDGRQVWYDGEPLALADAATFAVQEDVTGEVDARDGRHVWQRGRPGVAPPAQAASR